MPPTERTEPAYVPLVLTRTDNRECKEDERQREWLTGQPTRTAGSGVGGQGRRFSDLPKCQISVAGGQAEPGAPSIDGSTYMARVEATIHRKGKVALDAAVARVGI